MKSVSVWLALIAAAACSPEKARQVTSSVSIESDQSVTIRLDQTRIEVDPDVRYVLSAISTDPGRLTTAGTLDGHPFGMRGEEFFIGPESYGRPPAGATVHVRRAGVFFDLERRGDLPPALAAE